MKRSTAIKMLTAARNTAACFAGFGIAGAVFALAGCGTTPAEQAQARAGLICVADTLGNIRTGSARDVVRAIGETQLTDTACAASLGVPAPLPTPPLPPVPPAPAKL